MSLRPVEMSPCGALALRVLHASFGLQGLLRYGGHALLRVDRLRGAQTRLLRAVGAQDSLATVAQLARIVKVSRQAAHLAARALADFGYIELVPNFRHRRAKLVQLSHTGADLLNSLDFLLAPLMNRLGGNVSTEQLYASIQLIESFTSIYRESVLLIAE